MGYGVKGKGYGVWSPLIAFLHNLFISPKVIKDVRCQVSYPIPFLPFTSYPLPLLLLQSGTPLTVSGYGVRGVEYGKEGMESG